MFRTAKIVWLIVTATGMLTLAACSPGSQAAPTIDANTVYTQAAGTVMAQLTQAAALTPSATATTAPSNTPEPTKAVEQPSAQAPLPTLATTPIPVASATKALPADRAEYLGQGVADNTKFDPGANFTMMWKFKNTGATTWTTSYLMRFYTGDQLGAPATVKFPKEVKPGDTVELSVNMRTPNNAGSYNSIWVLTNADGLNFSTLFNLQIQVGSLPTSTNTSAPAATNTTAPAATNTPEPTATP